MAAGQEGRGPLAEAIEHHRHGRLSEAETLYRGILAVAPEDPDATHFLGVLMHQSGRGAEALEWIRKAIALRPDHADTHNNLGNVLKEQGRLEEAAAAYEQAIRLDAGRALAYHNLGAVLRQTGKLEQAIATYDWALALDPDHADTHYNRGNVLRQMGRFEEARVAYHRALALEDDHVGAYTCLGHVLYRLGRVDEARQVFHRWLERDPDHPVPRHMLAACSDDAVPERASDGYVETIFDNLAESYDDNLGSLEYRGPALVESMLAGSLGEPRGDLEVLDAGCGTGLCASLLRGHASRLTGVDLSQGMLERARERGAYDELVRSELTEFLGEHREAYDLVVSADTFVYFGELAPVLNAVAGALRPGGRLVFTLEREEDDPERGWVLHPHGRYGHGRSYLERVLGETGLKLGFLTDDVLRNEAGRPVRGWLVLARKGA